MPIFYWIWFKTIRKVCDKQINLCTHKKLYLNDEIVFYCYSPAYIQHLVFHLLLWLCLIEHRWRGRTRIHAIDGMSKCMGFHEASAFRCTLEQKKTNTKKKDEKTFYSLSVESHVHVANAGYVCVCHCIIYHRLRFMCNFLLPYANGCSPYIRTYTYINLHSNGKKAYINRM